MSFIFAVPCVMCLPLTEIDATPSQPRFPYAALQTSTRPTVALHFLPVVEPATTVVRSGLPPVDADQSLDAVRR